MNSGRGIQYNNRKRSYDRSKCYNKIIITSKEGSTLEIIELEVIKEIFKIDRSYDRCTSRDRHNRGRLSRSRRGSGSRNRVRSTSRDSSEEENVIIAENQDII